MRESQAIVTRGLPTGIIPEQHRHSREVCLKQLPTLELPIPESNSGLLRLDADTRRIPLSWPVIQQDGTVKDEDTLAWITAKAADASALETAQLQRARRGAEQPFSTMTKLNTFSALRIVCGEGAKPTVDWQACTSAERMNDINGAIVVIGDHNGETDQHSTIGGLIYGVDLQANYVAALLDQRTTLRCSQIQKMSLYWSASSLS